VSKIVRHAFTVDVEEWYHAFRFYREPSGDDAARLQVGLGRLLALLDTFGVKATFFWVGELAAKHADLVRGLAQAGHEIGCHGLRHAEMVYDQTPAAFARETRDALDLTSRAAGCEVRLFRAPCFSINERALWAFDVLADLGVEFDSSVFPVRNWRYGIPGFPLRPVRVGCAQRLWEVPLSVRRVGGVDLPAAGGAYFRIYPYRWTAANIRAVEACGRFVVFYIHPWELDPEHPIVATDWRARTTHYVNLHRTEARLRRLLADFEFGPLGAVTEACHAQPAGGE
jgi:polysaccharide deacetylase family protein (PEP-CTERM system associated)